MDWYDRGAAFLWMVLLFDSIWQLRVCWNTVKEQLFIFYTAASITTRHQDAGMQVCRPNQTLLQLIKVLLLWQRRKSPAEMLGRKKFSGPSLNTNLACMQGRVARSKLCWRVWFRYYNRWIYVIYYLLLNLTLTNHTNDWRVNRLSEAPSFLFVDKKSSFADSVVGKVATSCCKSHQSH